MTSETVKLKSKLSTLSNSLDDLENKLEPLLAQGLPESLADLETIQQAKLQIILPYLVYDLIFIYLKSRGIDPKSHPVVSELDRVKQYFEKLSNAEGANQRKSGIDKAAAGRFIKHAITQAKYGRPPGDGPDAGPSQESSDIRVPVKVTSKMIEREQYEKEMKDLGSEEEDTLAVFDDIPVENQEDGLVTGRVNAKGKQKAGPSDIIMKDDSQLGTKRRRPAMDPFGGYGDDTAEGGTQVPQIASTIQSPKKSKYTSSGDNTNGSDYDMSGPSTPASTAESKQAARAAKKAKRTAKLSQG